MEDGLLPTETPLQYKAVPVTEYVLVYRKHTDLLIDWFIRNHPDRNTVEASKISDGYEKTNIWKINPSTSSKHPAAFPIALAEKVIRYYSFKGDVVLDPLPVQERLALQRQRWKEGSSYLTITLNILT